MTALSLITDLFCTHKLLFFWRNIYGDEINTWDARSVWECFYCGKVVLKQELCEED
jgi:hypothetical protein